MKQSNRIFVALMTGAFLMSLMNAPMAEASDGGSWKKGKECKTVHKSGHYGKSHKKKERAEPGNSSKHLGKLLKKADALGLDATQVKKISALYEVLYLQKSAEKNE